MLEPEGPSDEGSPSSSSRFELVMLEFCEEETLNNLHDHQTCIPFISPEASDKGISKECKSRNVTLANIGFTSYMSRGEGVALDAIPIFRSEFMADNLDKNLLDNEEQLEALRQHTQ
ncbi:hypothetical protein ACFXTN_027742 [Malus domestica]